MSVTPMSYTPTTKSSRNRTAAVPPSCKPATTDRQEARKPYSGTLEERNALIVEYLPLVKFIANRIAGRLPSHVEVDDLIESGIIGLIDALDKFDPSMKTKFKTYAEFRIRGAILDELRALDWVPRSTRQKATMLDRAYAELEQRLGRAASDSEMIAHLGINAREFDEMLTEARGVALISLDELRGQDSDGLEHSLVEYLADTERPTAAQNLSTEQLHRIVADTIDQLPEKERLVISLYYYEELTMKEIGEVLSVTESRISQIHTKAVLRLRGRLLKALEE